MKRKFIVYQEISGGQPSSSDPLGQRSLRGGAWRWRLKASNGRIVASSGESFSSKAKAVATAVREARLYLPGRAGVFVEPDFGESGKAKRIDV